MTPDPISRLDRRLILEAETRSADGGGGATIGWASVATVWAAVAFSGGNEPFEFDRTRGRRDCDVTIRHREGLVPGNRFRDDTRVYEIIAITPSRQRRRWLSCRCEERDL